MKFLFSITVTILISTQSMSQNFFGHNAPQHPKEQIVVSLPDMPNATDKQGRKQGIWAKKYSNGNYSYIAHFVDGIPVDTTIRFFENGKRSSIQIHLNADNCKAIIYDENGKKSSEGLYVKEHRNGEWQFFRPNGKIASREFYKNGQLDGISTTYYESGEIFEEMQYVNGIPSGFWKQFYKNGKKQLETTFLNGNLNGTYKCWNDGGTITLDGRFNNGVKVGNWKVFDTDNGSYFYMKYDNNGVLTNQAEIDSRNIQKMANDEKNSKNLSDPENFKYNPEEYNR